MTEPSTRVLYSAETARACGGCSLCCKLLPMPELNKSANARCEFQKFGKGCLIYEARPFSCRHWSCRWLLGDDTADIPRPDRAHYVIDPVPDFVRVVNRETGDLVVNWEVVQVWVDPNYPDAHRDPALRRYLLRRGAEGIAAVIRLGSQDGFSLIPPNMTDDKQWHEVGRGMIAPEHSFSDYLAAGEQNRALTAKAKNK